MWAESHPSADADDLVIVRRGDLDQLRAESRELRARFDALERQICGSTSSTTSGTEDGGSAEAVAPVAGEPVARRRALLLGIAGAAAGVAAVAGPARPAAAANGDAMKIAFGNTATGGTALTVMGTTASHGFAVLDQGLSPIPQRAALFGHASSRFLHGVFGFVPNGTVSQSAVTGAAGGAATGVSGSSSQGTGGEFSSGSSTFLEPAVAAYASSLSAPDGGTALMANAATHLWMFPNSATPAPPESPLNGYTGQLRWTSKDPDPHALWACIGGGAPGTWRKVVGQGTAGALHLLPTPVRIYDSRAGTTPAQGPKTPLPARNIARTIDCKHNGSGVPVGATGVVLTVLLASAAAGAGNLTIWAADKPKPQSNTMVWGGSAGRFTATALSALDAQARIKIDASLSTNVILDVVGYYR